MPQSKKARQITRIVKDADELIQGIGKSFGKLKKLVDELREVKEKDDTKD